MFQVNLAGTGQSSLVTIGTNISSQNASINNLSVTSLSVVNLKTATFSPDQLNLNVINASAINLDPNFVFPTLNVSTLFSEKQFFNNLSAVNISANKITAENLQPLLIAGENVSILNNTISVLNDSLPANANFNQLNVSQINASIVNGANLSTGDLQIGQNLTLTNKLLNVNAINSVTAGSSALVTSGAVFNVLSGATDMRSLTNTKLIGGGDVIKPIVAGTVQTIDVNIPAGTSRNIMKVFYTTKFGPDALLGVIANFSYEITGSGADSITARLEFNQGGAGITTIRTQAQIFRNGQGGGTRSGVLSPIVATRRSNLSAGTQVFFQVIIQNDSDDTFTFLTPDSCTFHITENLDVDTIGSTSLALGTGILSANGLIGNTLNIQPGSGNGFATIGRTFLGNTAFSNMACLSINGAGGADNYGFGQVANNQTIMNAIPGQYNSFRVGNTEVGAYNNIGLGIRLGLGNLPLFPLHVSGSAFIDGEIFTDEIIAAEGSITNLTSSNLSVLNISASNISATTVNISGTLTVNGQPFTTTTLQAGNNISISNNVISAFVGSGSVLNLNSAQIDNDVDIGGSLTVGVTSRFDESLNVGNSLFVGDPGLSEGDVILFSNIVGNNFASKINSSTLELNCSATGTMNAINYFVKNNKALTINASGINAPIINVSVLNASNLSTANLALGQGLETITLFPSQQKLLRLIETPQQAIDRVFAAGFITTKNVTINDFTTTRTLINTISITTPLINSSVGNFSNINLNNISTPSIHATNISSNDLTTNIFTCIDGKATFRFNTPTLNASTINASTIPGFQPLLTAGNNISILNNVISTEAGPIPTNPNFSSVTATTGNISTLNVSKINLITDGSDFAMNVSGTMNVITLNVSNSLFLKGSDQFFGSEVQAPNNFGGPPRSRVNFWSSNASFEVGLRMGINEDNFAILRLEEFGNVGRYNINISNFSTMDMDNASTKFHHPVAMPTLNASTINGSTLNIPQASFSNISITNNVSVVGSIDANIVAGDIGDFVSADILNISAVTIDTDTINTSILNTSDLNTTFINTFGGFVNGSFRANVLNVPITGNISLLNVSLVQSIEVIGTDMDFGTGFVSSFKSQLINASTINASIINGANLSTASMAIGQGLELNPFQNTLQLTQTPAQAIAELETAGITTTSINTSGLNVDGLTTLDAVGVSISLQCPTINATTINVSSALNSSNINVSNLNIRNNLIVDGSLGIGINPPERLFHVRGRNAIWRLDRDVNSAALQLHRFDTNFVGDPIKGFVMGCDATGPNDGHFFINDYGRDVVGNSTPRFSILNDGEVFINQRLTTPVGNFSTINASNITGFQPLLTAGNNISILNNVISTEAEPIPTNPNFSSVAATTGNISTLNASKINLITDGSDFAMNVSGTMNVITLNVSNSLFLKGSDQFFGSEVQAPNNFGGPPRSRVNFWSSNASFEVGLRMGISEDNFAILRLEEFGNVGRYNINISNFSTMDMDNASTKFHHPVAMPTLNVSSITATTITGFQPLLTAGTNITISGTTISATGGGTLPANANFSSVTATTMNASTINASSIPGFQPTLIAGANISIIGNTISSIGEPTPTDPNFSSVTATTINTSTINASSIPGFQPTLIAGANISINGNTISSIGEPTPTDPNFSSVTATTINTSTINASSIPGFQPTLIAGANISINGNTISSVDPQFPTNPNFSTITATTGNFSTINSSNITGFQRTLNAGDGITISGNNTISAQVPIPVNLNLSNIVADQLIVTDEMRTPNILLVGENTNNSTPKSIQFGGLQGDNEYNLAVIENRIYSLPEKSELLLFKGNDEPGNDGPDRIRLRAAQLDFDTYNGVTNNRVAENIRMTIKNDGNISMFQSLSVTKGIDALIRVQTPTLNVSTVNASNITGFQKTLIAGSGITITGTTISSTGTQTLPTDPNFSSVTATTGNFSTINASSITGFQPLLTAGTNISIVGNTINTTTNLSCTTLNTSGNVTIGGLVSSPNQVRFKASRTASFTVNTNITLPFNKTIENVGGGYNNTTFTFTAPVAGTYYFYTQIFTSGNSLFKADFFSGSSLRMRISREGGGTGAGGNTTFTGSFHQFLNVGQTMRMVRSDGLGAINLPVDPFCFFGGYLLG